MNRFVVDCGVVLHLASEGIEVPAEHELLAPTLLRSQTLSALHEAVHRGELPPGVGRDQLARIRVMPIRLLGDAVLRRRAWDLAEQLGWAETFEAEYIALTQLQADAFVTLDAELARRVEGSSRRRRSKSCCGQPDLLGRPRALTGLTDVANVLRIGRSRPSRNGGRHVVEPEGQLRGDVLV